MKKFWFFVVCIFFAIKGFASHIVGGEMIYEFLRADAAAKTKTYRITLRLFRDELCTNCAPMPGEVWIGIFNNDNNAQVPAQSNRPQFIVSRNNTGDVKENPPPPCIKEKPPLSYFVATYTFEVTLNDNQKGYTASYQTCCRVAPLQNVINNVGGGGSGTGSTYACFIPGLNDLPTGINNSPQFSISVSTLCQNRRFTLDFGATDADGDQLVYSFIPAFNGGRSANSTNINPSAPAYGPVNYINGFSEDRPLGDKATINSSTGIISGIAPVAGKYVVCVNIDEYRNGKLIAVHKKDFIVNVGNCDFAGAELEPNYITCNAFDYTFQNLNPSPLNQTYLWDFGDGNTSTDVSPNHTYKDTGIYTIKLSVNKGQVCGEEATSVIKVFPGFVPDFSFKGICFNKPTIFTDNTTTAYGVVNSWKWNFSDPTNTNGTSTRQNPAYTYKDMGTKNVQLIVTNSKGCVDTIVKPVQVMDKPALSVAFKDTLICNGDPLQLRARGDDGVYSWTPATSMINGNTPEPTVTPVTTTKYFVKLDAEGCINNDSVNVRVVDFVTLKAFNDTTICTTDTAMLGANTNGLRFAWSPTTGVQDPTKLYTTVRPTATTTYTITARIGRCTATDDITIATVPYPTANAGADTTLCYFTTARLQGSMVASSFTWTPAAQLVNSNSLSPATIGLRTTTRFVLTVRDVLGCPKPVSDTVVVRVLPKINAFAGRDTAVVLGQPLQLQATGGVGYRWEPSTFLSNVAIANPVARFNSEFENLKYKVIVSNEANCIDSAFVNVRVFTTPPSVFVPDAFTPNGDGKNDVFKPVAAGIAQMDYFRVYNRWGQLVFSTSVNGQGWDGKIKGQDQGSATFVWVVKATDYQGKPFFAKGTVVLIR